MARASTWLLLLVGSLRLLSAAAAADRPNVLIILADDLGFSDLGCYGGEIRTTHLDALAAGGLRFSSFYNTGRCWPTRASLLTGYYAQQVRRDEVPGQPSGSRGQRPRWATLLPARLQAAGYRTYHAGKWHLDGEPLRVGFDRSYRVDDHDRYFQPQRQYVDDRPVAAPSGAADYVTTMIADRAIDFLREHATAHADRPFFTYLCFTSPHFPLQAPADDIARYREHYARGWNEVRQARYERIVSAGWLKSRLSPVETNVGPPYEFPEALMQLGPAELNRPRDWAELNAAQQSFQAAKMSIHAAMIDRMDQEIGRVLAQLRQMDAWQNTLIVFLSDNGASAEIMVRGDGHDPMATRGSAGSFLCLGPGWSTVANTPLRRHKTWVHEGGIATPLIVHWPQRISTPGAWRHQCGHVIDLVPTIMKAIKTNDSAPALASSNSPEAPPFPGLNLLPWLTDPNAPTTARTLWWRHEGHRAWRDGDWKLVAAREQTWELYQVSQDRSETQDCAATEIARVAEMAARWESAWHQYQQDALNP